MRNLEFPSSEIQKKRLRPGCGGLRRGIGVNREKQIGPFFVGDGGAPLERDKPIVFAGQYDFDAHESAQ